MFLAFGISFFTESIPKEILWGIMYAFIIAMVLIAATKPGTTVSDYNTYYNIFINYDSIQNELAIEPTYRWLSRFLNNIHGPFRTVFWVFAIISVPLKIYAFKRLSSYDVLFAAFPVYLSNFFLLHDCEQIRIAAAMAFVIMAYALWAEHKKWYWWLGLWSVSILFHYTATVALFPMILSSRKELSFRRKIILICGVFTGAVFWILKVNAIMLIPIPAIQMKMALYEIASSNGEQMESILLYHPIALLRYATFFYVLYYSDLISPHVKGLNVILTAEALGLAAWGGLAATPVFAVRISELLQIPECILFASVFYTTKPQWAAKFYPMAVAMYIFLYGIRINQFGYL